MFYHRTVFFVFLALYGSALLYTGIHLAFLAPLGRTRTTVLIFWGILGISMPLSRRLGGLQLQRLGGTVLGFVTHFSLAFAILDAWWLLFSLFPSLFGPPKPFLVLNLMLLWMAWGVARAQNVVVRNVEIFLPLPPGAPAREPLTLVAVSDIHVGGSVNPGLIDRIGRRIAECHPDILLLVGDTLDGDPASALSSGIEELLSGLRAPLGKYAVLGNHELYAGEAFSRELLERAGFIVLQDEGRIVDGVFLLIGRNDPRGNLLGSPRAPLVEVLERASHEFPSGTGLPLIVADHTPEGLEESVAAEVPLQISGHTHGGQVFPFNFFVLRRYGVVSGLLRRGNTVIYVSSGAGFWHMPLRTVSTSEIVRFILRFSAQRSDATGYEEKRSHPVAEEAGESFLKHFAGL